MDGIDRGIWAQLLGFFVDQQVDELLINSARSVAIVAGERVQVGRSPFGSGQEMLHWLTLFAREEGVRLDPICGSAGGMVAPQRLTQVWNDAGQLRWHALLPPLSQDGPLLALRRHRFGVISLTNFGGTDDVKGQLSRAMGSRRSLLIAGPTGSGKSTLLVALLAAHASQERVLILESVAEIPSLFPTWVRLLERLPNLEGVGAVSLDRLLKESLRLRPDRLVLGEIRGSEAQPFFNALLSGHDGAMATIHAGTVHEARHRFGTLASNHGGCQGEPLDSKFAVLGEASAGLDVVLMKRGNPPIIAGFDDHKTSFS
jgi:pilus assembly protein CpaF